MKTKFYPKPTGHNRGISEREVYSSTILPQEKRKIRNNLNLHLQQLEREQTKSTVRRRKGLIQIRGEINETIFEKINKTDKMSDSARKKQRGSNQ